MDDYLSKPFTLGQLREKLEHWLPADRRVEQFEYAVTTGALSAQDGEAANGSEELALLDVRALAQIQALQSDTSANVLDKVIDLFVESSADLLEQMHGALESGDMKVIEDAAHTLKTSGAHVGALTLSSMCKQLEVFCRDSDHGSVASAIRNLQVEYGKVCRALTMERRGDAA